MDNSLKHHGIKGQKWGVRRTPAQLGHAPSGSKNHGTNGESSGKNGDNKPQKSAGKSAKHTRSMSDDELRERINRLNMKEQYENLVARQKQRHTGTVKNLLGEAAESFGQKALGLAVDKLIDKIKSDKHKLDWKQSERDNDIAALRKRYQEHPNEDGELSYGASTLISRAKAPVAVLKRKGSPKINPETGELEYKSVEETYTDKKGKTKVRTQDSTQMAETKDARRLSSGTPQEEAYADYANRMKAMANEARKEILRAGKIEYSSTAR